MITVEPTTDATYIKSVFLNPTIYSEMRDDSCPVNPQDLAGTDVMAIPGIFLRVLVEGIAGGVFLMLWKDAKIEVHTALMENCRGRKAIAAARAARDWVFANTTAQTITSYAWSDAPAVAWFCRAMGMIQGETKPWTATRKGKPVDITYYNLNRGAT